MIKLPNAKRGSTFRRSITFSGTSGTIASSIVRVFVKQRLTDLDSNALLQLDNQSLGGVTIIAATTPYEIEVEVNAALMAALPAKEVFVAVQIEAQDGTVQEVENLEQRMLVTADVVRRAN
jgi:hypothetical protein